jgi:hypothetical protein
MVVTSHCSIAGGLMMAGAFRKTSEQFVGRFMILTTVQLLSIMSIIAAVLYTKQPQGRHLTFNIMAVFVAMLAIQTVLLISGLRKK